MGRNIPQGSGAKGRTPRSPAPAPGPSSATGQRLTQLDDGLNEVRRTSVPVLGDKIESNSMEIEWQVVEVLETIRRARGLDRYVR